MQKTKNIVGYVVLDQGRPVQHTPSGYFTFYNRYPISIFPSRKVANRVRRLLRDGYFAQACKFDNPEDPQHQRCFKLWNDRGEAVKIRPVQKQNPSVEQVRAYRREAV